MQQQQAAMSEVYTPTVSARSPGWLSEEEEATSLQDKVSVPLLCTQLDRRSVRFSVYLNLRSSRFRTTGVT